MGLVGRAGVACDWGGDEGCQAGWLSSGDKLMDEFACAGFQELGETGPLHQGQEALSRGPVVARAEACASCS